MSYGDLLNSTAPPVISNVLPALQSEITPTTPISFDVTAENGLGTVFISYEDPTTGVNETVYDGTAFTLKYVIGASVTAIGGGKSFRFSRSPKWFGSKVNIIIFAYDQLGNFLSVTFGWTLPVPVTSSASSGAPAVVADPFGFGLLRPFRRTEKNDFLSGRGVDLVKSAVGQILGTARGELRWRPSFGTYLSRLRHMRNSSALIELARISIQEALKRWEPRVEVIEVTAEPIGIGTENQISLSLVYRIGNGQETSISVEV